jgi:hypothetical protein
MTERVMVSSVHMHGAYAAIQKTLVAKASANDDRFREPDEFLGLAKRTDGIAHEHRIELEVCCSPGIRPEDRQRLAPP